MTYHEIRNVNGHKYNYLVYNKREKNRWIKKAKFIGKGNIKKDRIEQLKSKFELEIKINKNYEYLTKHLVEELEKIKHDYNNKIRDLTREEYEIFEKTFFTELTYNSNAIEGNSLSLDETSLVINDNIVPEGKTLREIYEAKNHIKAVRFIKEYKLEIDERFILRIHHMILNGISDRFTGRYRETNVRIFGSNVRFPDSNLVQQLMKNLFYWYNLNKKKYHPFELATVFSMKLVTIHPFVDGNGRVSRLVMNYILKKNGYPWINIYNKQRNEYLKAVRKANDGDYKEIIEFLIKTLKTNLDEFKLRN